MGSSKKCNNPLEVKIEVILKYFEVDIFTLDRLSKDKKDIHFLLMAECNIFSVYMRNEVIELVNSIVKLPGFKHDSGIHQLWDAG